MKVICISNKCNVSLANGKSPINLFDELFLVESLKVGCIYDISNIIGQVFRDLETNDVIDCVILKEFKNMWLPTSLFMEVDKWRDQQINKIL